VKNAGECQAIKTDQALGVYLKDPVNTTVRLVEMKYNIKEVK